MVLKNIKELNSYAKMIKLVFNSKKNGNFSQSLNLKGQDFVYLRNTTQIIGYYTTGRFCYKKIKKIEGRYFLLKDNDLILKDEEFNPNYDPLFSKFKNLTEEQNLEIWKVLF